MKRITRSQAIEDLRDVLLRMADEQNSLCRVVTWRKLFCRGFSQWNQAELERRFPGMPQRACELQRGHQELMANDKQLARQDIHARTLPCDVTPDSGAPCAGWDEFDDRELARFHREICGQAVQIVPDDLPPASA